MAIKKQPPFAPSLGCYPPPLGRVEEEVKRIIGLSMNWSLDWQTPSQILKNQVARNTHSLWPRQFDPELAAEGLTAASRTNPEDFDCLRREAQTRRELSRSLNKFVSESMNRSTWVNSGHMHAPVRRHDNQPFLSVPCHT